MNNDAENNETLKDALRAYGLKQDIQRIHKEMMNSMTKPSKEPGIVKPFFGYLLKFAAAILLILFSAVIFVYVNSTPENLFRSKFEPYLESAQRGNEIPPASIKYKFLEGQSYLQAEQPLQAITIFSDILEQNKSTNEKIFNDDAEYYLALSYLKAGRPGEALQLFRKIHNDPPHLYNDQVSSWFLLKVKVAAWKNK